MAEVKRPETLTLTWQRARYFVSRPNIDTQEIYLASEADAYIAALERRLRELEKETEYYIITTNHEALWPRGVLLFWAPNNCGYATTLESAGRYSKEKAEKIQAYRGGDYMVPCEAIESAAVRVVDYDKLREFIDSEQKEQL